MKSKTVLVLIGILAVCTAYVLVRHLKPRGEGPAAPAEKPLFDAPFEAARELRIAAADGTTLAFEKTDLWRIVRPIQAKADAWKVDQIYDAVKDLRGLPADEATAEVTGLDKPLWTVTAKDEKGAARTIHVGRPRPLSAGQTYVRPADGKAFVVREDFAYKLDRPVSEFRDKTVLDFIADDVVRLGVQGRESYELKKDKDAWGLTAPVSAEADGEKVRGLLDKVARLTVREFLPDEAAKNLEAYALAEGQERLTVQVWMKDEQPASAPPTSPESQPASQPAKPGKTYRLALGRQSGDEVYGRIIGEPTLFRADASLLNDLQPKLIDLRQRKVVSAEADAVTRVELHLPGGEVCLEKQDAAWRMVKPLAGEASGAAVRTLLDKAAALRATDFRDDAASLEAFGLDAPRATITFHLSGKDQTVSLLVGGKSPSGEMTFVKTASGKAVAVVPSTEVEPLLADGPSYWNTSLLKTDPQARITRVSLARPEGEFTLQRGEDDTWKLTAPLSAKVETATVEKIVDDLKSVSTEKIVSLDKSVPDKYAQAKDRIRVTFTAVVEPASQPATAASQPETAESQPASAESQPETVKSQSASAESQPSTAESQPEASDNEVEEAATLPDGAATKPAKPVSRTYTLYVAKVEDKAYAWVEGGEVPAVGEVRMDLYDSLAAEVRDRVVLNVKAEDVDDIRIVAGEKTLELRRTKDEWTCTADRFVRIDGEKAKTYLEQFKDFKAEKFASHKAAEAGQFGLDKPKVTVELKPRTGESVKLTVSEEGPGREKQHYATASGVEGVFVLTTAAAEKLAKTLDDFKKATGESSRAPFDSPAP